MVVLALPEIKGVAEDKAEVFGRSIQKIIRNNPMTISDFRN